MVWVDGIRRREDLSAPVASPEVSVRRRRYPLLQLLAVAAFFASAWFIAQPYLPQLVAGQPELDALSATLPQQPKADHIAASFPQAPLPAAFRLRIPAIELNEPIFDGQDANVLEKGVWHLPWSAGALDGNVVLAGHRWLPGSPVRPFFRLTEVTVGDWIYLSSATEERAYQVSEVLTVLPTDTWIEDPTETARLTLYTCAPLLTGAKRFVVVAQPAEASS